MQIDVYVLRSVRQNPRYTRKVGKCSEKGSRDSPEEEVRLQRPKRGNKDDERRDKEEARWESIEHRRKSNAYSHLLTQHFTMQQALAKKATTIVDDARMKSMGRTSKRAYLQHLDPATLWRYRIAIHCRPSIQGGPEFQTLRPTWRLHI